MGMHPLHRRRHHRDAGAGRHQVQVAHHARHLGHHPRLEALGLAQRQQVGVQPGRAGLAHQDEALVAQIGQRQRPGAAPRRRGQGVVTGQGHHGRLAQQGLEHQAGRARHRHAQQAAVQAPGQQFIGQLGGVVLAEHQADLRVLLAAGAQAARHKGMGGGRTGVAQRQPALLAARQRAQPGFGGVHRLQQAVAIIAQQPAGLGQRHALGMALEQLQAQRLLQRLDLLAQRRLLQAQRRRRPGDVAALGHRHEVAQLPQIHMNFILK